jgi:hypothetical protein
MKNLILSIALGALLIAPAFASGSGDDKESSKPVVVSKVFTFSGNSDKDTVQFNVTAKNAGKDVQVGASWSDMLVNNDSFNGQLNWSLSGAASRAGSLVDGVGKEGESFISLSGLAIGHYSLTFTGQWDAVSKIAPKGTEFELSKGSVSLEDVKFVNHISAVPEPESYALLLAGLGLIVGVIRRRQQKAAAI